MKWSQWLGRAPIGSALATLAFFLAMTTSSSGASFRSAVAQAARAERPNIVFVYVDDMGWRDLGVQGSTYYRTPNIDRLAAEGMRFTNAYANAPNCAPSRAALLSGQYAPRTGIYTVGSSARGRAENRKLVPVTNRETLALEVVTIAESLRDAGYATGQTGKWHLGGAGHLATDQGFSWAVGGDDQGSPPSHIFPYVRANRSLPGLEDGQPGEYLADRLTSEAIGFIERNQTRPFFLYLSHYGVHTPIQGRPDLVAQYLDRPGSQGQNNAAYAAMVESIDQSVGRLAETLTRLNLAANTIVIFTSDNGGFGPVTSMAPLRGSKGMVYEGGIREPLIVRWPGMVKPGAVSDVPVIGTDFYPTFLEMTGAAAPTSQILDGRSLVPVLTGRVAPPTRDLFWHLPVYLEADSSVSGPWRTTPASAIRRGNYKLVHFFEDDQWELYDLASDIAESRDLSSAMPARTAELRAALEHWWADTGAFIPQPKLPAEVFGIPLIDLDADDDRQVVVDREPGQYLGHPTTQLLGDGRTILTVYPKGHGQGSIVYKRSPDSGLTWSDRLAVPRTWTTSKEVPTLYRVRKPGGGNEDWHSYCAKTHERCNRMSCSRTTTVRRGRDVPGYGGGQSHQRRLGAVGWHVAGHQRWPPWPVSCSPQGQQERVGRRIRRP